MLNTMDDIKKRTDVLEVARCKFREKDPNKLPITVKIRAKNPDLYDDNESWDRESINSTKSGPDEIGIQVKLYESTGKNPLTEEEVWLQKVEIQRKKEEKEKEDRYKMNLYKNNPLMRNLWQEYLEKNSHNSLEEEAAVDEQAKSPNNETKVSEPEENGASLVQHPDDPDFYFLRDTTIEKSDYVDDDFYFKHYGRKTTRTPRSYAINDITDDQFLFRKKKVSD